MKNRIMFGVYLMYSWRKFKSPFIAGSLAFVMLTLTLCLTVSVPSFVANMSHSGHFLNYFLMAFSNTTLLVQSLVLTFGAVLIFSLRNFANILRLSHLSSVGRARSS